MWQIMITNQRTLVKNTHHNVAREDNARSKRPNTWESKASAVSRFSIEIRGVYRHTCE